MTNFLIAAGLSIYALYVLWTRRIDRSESSRLTALFNDLQPIASALCRVPMHMRGERFAIELTCVFNGLGSAERDIARGRWGWADFAIKSATARAQTMMRDYAAALAA